MRLVVLFTVEDDLVDLHTATSLATVDNSDGLSTTALSVGDGGSTSRARAAVLAGRTVRHAVVEFETSVKLGGDVVAGDGKTAAKLCTSRDGRVVVSLRTALTADHLVAAESSSGDRVVASSKAALALPALEVASTVLANRTNGQVAPGPSGKLDLDTLVGVVARAGEWAGVLEDGATNAELWNILSVVMLIHMRRVCAVQNTYSSRGLLDASGGQQNESGLHVVGAVR